MRRFSLAVVMAALLALVAQPAQAAGELPSAVTSLVVSGRSANQVDLSWNAPAYEGLTPVTSYNIYLRPVADNLWVLATSVAAPTTIASLTGLTAGVQYSFKVAAVNSAGEGIAAVYGQSLSIVAGSGFTCVQRPDQTNWCWGANDFGQFGSGDILGSSTPRQITAWTGFNALTAGKNFMCGLKQGVVYCAGDNSFGQLGDGTTTSSSVPVAVVGIAESVATVDAGDTSVCAVGVSGDMYCWGDNTNAMLGDGGNISSLVAKRIMISVISVSVGTAHACAIVQGGAVMCWGSESLTPTELPVLANSHMVSVGRAFDSTGDMCAITASRTVLCWASLVSPVFAISGPTLVTDISVGTQHACAVEASGATWCWGLNQQGQLGNGTTLSVVGTVIASPGFVDVAAAGDDVSGHTCASSQNGSVYCWGANSAGQVGNGTTNSALTPSKVGTFAAITASSAVPPTAVSGLTFVARTETSIALSWSALTAVENDNVPLLNYAVEVSSNGVDWTRSLVPANTTSTTVTGLLSATTYQVRVAGITAAGVGAFSAESSMRTSSLPDQVTGLTFVSRSATTLSVAWSEPLADGLPVLSYKVEWMTGSAPWQSAVVVGSTSYTIGGLTAASSYRVRVSATSAAGTGLASAELTDRTSNPPDIVTGLTHVARTESSISISWTAPLSDGLPLISYEIQYFLGSAVEPVKTYAPGNATSSTLTGLLPNSTYRIRIAALSSAGVGPASAELTDRTLSSPAAVTGIANTGRTVSSISLSWSAPTADGLPILDYLVEWRSAPGVWLSKSVAGTSTVIDGLNGNTDYTIRISARSAAGLGTASAEWLDHTLRAPNQVTGLTNTGRTLTTISVSWTEPAADGLPVLDYLVEWSSAPGVWTSKTVTTAAATIDGLQGNTDYSIRVSARSAAGRGTASAEWADHTLRVPGKVTGLTHVSRTDTSIEISWTLPASDSPITQLTIEWSRDGVNWPSKFLTGSQAGLTQFTITSLQKASNYRIRITAGSAAGIGATSDVFLDRTSHEPAQVTGVALVSRGAKNVSLSWTRPDSDGIAITGYKIEASKDGVQWLSQVVAGEVTSGAIAGLEPNTVYQLRVSAINAAGTGLASASIEARTSHAPAAVASLTLSARTATSVSITWLAPDDDGSPIKYYSVEYSPDNLAWNSLTVQNASALLTDLAIATSYYVRVTAVNDAGASPISSAFLFSTQGSRTDKVAVQDSLGRPVTGGTISWHTADNLVNSAVSTKLDSTGKFEISNLAPSEIVVSLTNGEMADGTLVSGEWHVFFGLLNPIIKLPLSPSALNRSVTVQLANGRPVIGAKVTTSNFVGSVVVEGVTFTITGFVASGKTDIAGQVQLRGFATGVPVATATYFDGSENVVASAEVTGLNTIVSLTNVAWVKSAFTTKTVSSAQRVEIVISALSAAGPQANVAVRMLAPKGATQSGCKAVLRGTTNALGKVKLYVCATKSGVYRISATGAIVTSAVTLLVNGTAPMPVTRLTAKSLEPRTLSLGWIAPQFNGGSKVTQYLVTVTGGGKTIKRSLATANLTLRGLSTGVTYQVSVVAKNASGLSDPSVTSIAIS